MYELVVDLGHNKDEFSIMRGHIQILIFLVCSIHTSAQLKSDSSLTYSNRPTMEIDSMNNSQFYNGVQYVKPKAFSFLLQLPKTFALSAKLTFRKQSIPALSLIAASTIVLITLDQGITDHVQQFGRYIRINPSRDYKTLVSFKLGSSKIPVYEAPKNINSGIYSMGEGFTSLALCGGLFVYGKIKNDYRALQTASQILQAQLAVGVISQAIKRISGRESPSVATKPGGAWRPFSSFAQYQNHTSTYDALPSGHLATITATVTVLTLNYPEKKWIRPVGYGLIGLVGVAMINNGAHWAGDYPLAIGIGYITALATVKLNKAINHRK